MPRDRSDIVAALSTKGFGLKSQGRDHDFFFFRHPNLTQAVYTKLSRGTAYKTISDDLLSKISRQLRLTRKQFDLLVDCPMDRAEYTGVLQSQGVIRR